MLYRFMEWSKHRRREDAPGPGDQGEGQLTHMLGMSEMLRGDAYENEAFHFSDQDNERLFLRAKEVALILVPVELIECGIACADNEDEDNDETPGASTLTSNA
jgi:hypothetical protein